MRERGPRFDIHMDSQTSFFDSISSYGPRWILCIRSAASVQSSSHGQPAWRFQSQNNWQCYVLISNLDITRSGGAKSTRCVNDYNR